MANIIDDLCTLTSIPRANIESISHKIEWLISNAAYEAYTQHDNFAEIDLSYGKLSMMIDTDNSQLQFKFSPSRRLQTMIIDAFENGKDPVADKIEDAVTKSMVKIYKDLM